MPRRDGTGPTGEGSMTGRGMGNCDNAKEGTTRQGLGCRRGRGRGCGFGRKVEATNDK